MDSATRLKDWLDHARGNRRRAFEYRREALRYEADGNLPRYRQCRDQSDRSWRLAWNALANARIAKEIMQ